MSLKLKYFYIQALIKKCIFVNDYCIYIIEAIIDELKILEYLTSVPT